MSKILVLGGGIVGLSTANGLGFLTRSFGLKWKLKPNGDLPASGRVYHGLFTTGWA
jgi:hypothetical protein